MSYKIKNRLSQPIICTVGDGSSLCIDAKAEVIIADGQVNSYLKGIAEKKYITISKVGDVTKDNVVVVQAKEAQQKRKGGKDNGGIS